jgi:hypothetical protein
MNKKNQTEDRLVINLSQIPIESNLGLLAYGDIAFEAWRRKKRKLNLDKNE